jgi:hypothetical protein
MECADLGFHKAPCLACTLTSQILITTVLYSVKITEQCIQRVKEQCNLTVFNGGIVTAVHGVGTENVCLILFLPPPETPPILTIS